MEGNSPNDISESSYSDTETETEQENLHQMERVRSHCNASAISHQNGTAPSSTVSLNVHQDLEILSLSPQPSCFRGAEAIDFGHGKTTDSDQTLDSKKSEEEGRKYGLANHLRTQSDEKSFQCETCGKSFNFRGTLYNHKRTHTKPLKCEVCGKDFAQKQNLKTYMLTHTGAQPFKCQLCGLSLTTVQSLQYHMNTHTGAKPYACKDCP